MRVNLDSSTRTISLVLNADHHTALKGLAHHRGLTQGDMVREWIARDVVPAYEETIARRLAQRPGRAGPKT